MQGGVVADGAVGQRGRAVWFITPPPLPPTVLPLTVQSVSVVVPPLLYRPPPLPPAELPLTVQLVSVVVPPLMNRPPPLPPAELPLTVQLVSVIVPPLLYRPPPFVGGVAADGAVGQRGRAPVVQAAAIAVVVPPGDRQAASEARRHSDRPGTPGSRRPRDRHARRRARDRLRLGRVGQLELGPVRVIVCGVAKTDGRR